jgi:hypothetical protein
LAKSYLELSLNSYRLMPSRKHRPIVMNRNKRPGRRYTGLKKVLSAAAILALIGIVILAVLHFNNAPKPVVNTGEKSTEVPGENTKEKIAEVVKNTAKPVSTKEPKIVTQSKQSPVARKTKPVLSERSKDTTDVNETEPAEIETVEKVSDEQMSRILDDVRAEKTIANHAARCVAIRIVNRRNAENGFKIANYLRKNGFVISGREIIKGNEKGIHIEAAAPCIRLTVGNL